MRLKTINIPRFKCLCSNSRSIFFQLLYYANTWSWCNRQWWRHGERESIPTQSNSYCQGEWPMREVMFEHPWQQASKIILWKPLIYKLKHTTQQVKLSCSGPFPSFCPVSILLLTLLQYQGSSVSRRDQALSHLCAHACILPLVYNSNCPSSPDYLWLFLVLVSFIYKIGLTIRNSWSYGAVTMQIIPLMDGRLRINLNFLSFILSHLYHSLRAKKYLNLWILKALHKTGTQQLISMEYLQSYYKKGVSLGMNNFFLLNQ